MSVPRNNNFEIGTLDSHTKAAIALYFAGRSRLQVLSESESESEWESKENQY